MGGFLFVCPKRNQKCPGGCVPMNTSPKAGVHSLLPPAPPVTGDALQLSWQFRPAGKDKTVWSFLPRGHRPLQGRNLKVSALYAHHLVWQSCGSRAIDDDRTKQVGAHQAVYDREQKLANFDGNRPQWAEWRGVHGQNLGRRKRVRGQRDPLP